MNKKSIAFIFFYFITIYCFAGPVGDRSKLQEGEIMFEDFIELPIEQQIIKYIENNVAFLQFPDNRLTNHMIQNHTKKLLPLIIQYVKENSITNAKELYVLNKMAYLIKKLRLYELIDEKMIYYFYGLYQDKIINYIYDKHVIDENVVLTEQMLNALSGIEIIETVFSRDGDKLTPYYGEFLLLDDLTNITDYSKVIYGSNDKIF